MDNVKSFGYGVTSFSKSTKHFYWLLLFFVIFDADSERNSKIMLSHIDFSLLGFFF